LRIESRQESRVAPEHILLSRTLTTPARFGRD